MTPESIQPMSNSSAPDISAFLDRILSRLGRIERSAIVLRYLRGLDVTQVGAELQLSKAAVQKRLSRALAKIRRSLARHGIKTAEDALEAALGAQALCVAPPRVLAAALDRAGASAAPPANVYHLARGATKAMLLGKAAPAIAACALGAILITAVLQLQGIRPASAAAPPSLSTQMPPLSGILLPAAPSTQPAIIVTSYPNVTFTIKATHDNNFTVGFDTTVTREGRPTATVSSTTKQWSITGGGSRLVDYTPLLGKRMRFSAYVKTNNLANWGGLDMYAMGNERLVLHDDMGDRPITRTTDWTKLQIVADIPPETEKLEIGYHIHGAGQLWLDDAKLEIVGDDVPVTDDSIWHGWSFSSPHYSVAPDPAAPRDGHPTLCISSTVSKTGEWYAWDWNNRHPDIYRGKRIRMSAWFKTQNVTGPTGLNLRIMDGHLNEIAPVATNTIRGSNDWKQYEVIADIPAETQCICSGFRLNGKGKLWIDDVRYEVLEPAAVPKQN